VSLTVLAPRVGWSSAIMICLQLIAARDLPLNQFIELIIYSLQYSFILLRCTRPVTPVVELILIVGTYGDSSPMKGSSETESDGSGAVKYRQIADQSTVQVSTDQCM